MLVRVVTRLLSPPGARARLSTFIFHRVLDRPDPLLPSEPDRQTFARILGWIDDQFDVLHPLEACDRLSSGRLPARAAIITFDDGYRDNYEVALPVLQGRRLTAAFFIATGFIGGGAMFNDRVIEAVRRTREEALDLRHLGLGCTSVNTVPAKRSAIDAVLARIKHMAPEDRDGSVEDIERACGAAEPPDLMMNETQVATLARLGMEVGGHTRSHPILNAVDDTRARAEITECASDLENITGSRPSLFAYPNGREGLDFEQRHAAIVRDAGFTHAFTTDPGYARAETDRMRLPRFTPWRRTEAPFKVACLANLCRVASKAGGAPSIGRSLPSVREP